MYSRPGTMLTTVLVVAAIALIFAVALLTSFDQGGFNAVRNIVSKAADEIGFLFGMTSSAGGGTGSSAGSGGGATTPSGKPPEADAPPDDAGKECQDLSDCPDRLVCNDVAPSFQQHDKACCLGERKWDGNHCVYTQEGKRCKQNLCGGNLACQKAHPKSQTSGFYCCPDGQHWDGNTCRDIKQYTILYLQVNSQISNFEQKAEQATQHWTKHTPLQQCSNAVKKQVEANQVCNIQPLNRNINAQGAVRALPQLHDCARQFGYAGDYTRVVGVVNRQCITNVKGCVAGLTTIRNDAVFANAPTMASTATHELGHTHGLCDVGYGGGSCSTAQGRQCESGYCTGSNSQPNKPACTADDPSVANCCPNAPGPGVTTTLCSVNSCKDEGRQCSDGEGFSQQGFTHLKNELVDDYCQ